jgi:hypothetical protein
MVASSRREGRGARDEGRAGAAVAGMWGAAAAAVAAAERARKRRRVGMGGLYRRGGGEGAEEEKPEARSQKKGQRQDCGDPAIWAGSGQSEDESSATPLVPRPRNTT